MASYWGDVTVWPIAAERRTPAELEAGWVGFAAPARTDPVAAILRTEFDGRK
jgi:hypothetical protein